MSIARGLVRASLVGLVVSSIACGSQGGGATGSSSAVASSAPPSASTASGQAPAASGAIGPADDLAVAPLESALKCPAAAGPCRVLSGFTGAKGWSGVSPGGEGRYLGRFYTVRAGKVEEAYAVLRTRNIPSNEAGAGRVPARLALALVPRDDKNASAYEKALKAFERKDVPAKGSPAFDLVKTMDGFVDASAMPTASGKVVVLTDDHAFVALGASQEIYVVSPRTGGAVSGDGGYGVLYPMSW